MEFNFGLARHSQNDILRRDHVSQYTFLGHFSKTHHITLKRKIPLRHLVMPLQCVIYTQSKKNATVAYKNSTLHTHLCTVL